MAEMEENWGKFLADRFAKVTSTGEMEINIDLHDMPSTVGTCEQLLQAAHDFLATNPVAVEEYNTLTHIKEAVEATGDAHWLLIDEGDF